MNLMQIKNSAHTASFLNAYDNQGFTPSQVLGGEDKSDLIHARPTDRLMLHIRRSFLLISQPRCS
jgi:hypothetical protein